VRGLGKNVWPQIETEYCTLKTEPAKLRRVVPLLLRWFSVHARDLPWRRSRDPYAIWVSEIMLQQTQVKTVIPYWERWMRELPTLQSVAKASPAKLHKLWEGLGYYTRVRNSQRAAQVMVAEHGGRFPENFAAVLALPGVGRYTAGAICSIAFNQPTPVLDGNIIRVLTRLFGITTNPREKQTNVRLWHLASELVLHASRPVAAKRSESSSTPHASPCSHLNQALMELGAVICTPRAPACAECPVRVLCVARKQNLQEQLPNSAQRTKMTARRFIAFVVERNGRLLVRQRPAGVLNSQLWEFPNLEILDDATPLQLARKAFGRAPAKLEPLGTIRHSITRYRITLEVCRAELSNSALRTEGYWLTQPQLQELAFTGAHKKILARLAAPGTGSAPHPK